MDVSYEPLGKTVSEYERRLAFGVADCLGDFLPSHARVEAVRMVGIPAITYAVFIVSEDAFTEQEEEDFMRQVRDYYGETYENRFDFKEGRIFVLYFKEQGKYDEA